MNWRIILKTSLDSIKRNKFRSILTLLGIVFGIACVAAMYNIGLAFQDKIKDELKTLGTNVIIVSEHTFRKGTYEKVQPVTIDDAAAIEKGCKEISLIIPFMMNYETVSFMAAKEEQVSVLGTIPEHFLLGDKSLNSGSFFGVSDVRSSSKVCVLGYDISKALFISQNPVGKKVIIDKVPFTVIGVLNELPGYSSVEPGRINNSIMIPYTASLINFEQPQYGKRGSLHEVIIVVNPKEDVNNVKNKILDILNQRYGFSRGKQEHFLVETLDEYTQFMKKNIDKQVIFLRIIALIALFIGGINIMNIMLVSVKERTREIGVRMALGARSRDIIFQFLTESVFLCFWGGIAGAVLSVPLSISLAKLINFAPKFSAGMIIVAFIYSSLTGVIFGVYPAKKAADLDPIEALRYE